MEEIVEIQKKRYRKLLEAEKILNALRANGVDNWDYYGDAMAEVGDEDDDETYEEIYGAEGDGGPRSA